MHIQEINFKNRFDNYYFDNLVKAEKLKTKNTLIDERNYKKLVTGFIRYVHWKTIKMICLYYRD